SEVLIAAAWPLTTTVSDTEPTSANFKVTRGEVLTRISMSAATRVLNPCFSALTPYNPGGTCGNENAPVPSDVAVRTAPVARFVNVTIAPGTTASDGSVTVPDNVAVCAKVNTVQ